MNEIQGKTILYVEDECITALRIKDVLERHESTVIHVASGEEAVRIIIEKKSTIDLILMDINLGPGIDGIDAAEVILKHSMIPLIFLTLCNENDVVIRSRKRNIPFFIHVNKISAYGALIDAIKMALKLCKSN
jgi:CheY-like chemotaxis protein